MLGTIVNSVAIIAGGLVGLLIKGNINEKYTDVIMQAIGLSVFFLGLSRAIQSLPYAETLLFIIALVIGGAVGEFLDIEGKMKALGDFAEKKLSKSKDSNISKGFVTASILYCTGAMAILGSFESGIYGDHRTLYTKSVLDGVISIIFASTMGVGVLLSAVSVFAYQGLLTVFSGFLRPFLSEELLTEISLVGGLLIACLGINLLKILKIKVANFLPSLLIPVLYFIIKGFFVN